MNNDDYTTRAGGTDSADYSTQDAPQLHRPRHKTTISAKAETAKPAVAEATKEKPAHHAGTAAAEHAPEHEAPWYHETDVWIAAAFLLFLLVALKYVFPPVVKGLDARSAKIRDQLEQANRLKAEAEALLDQYKAEQQKKLAEAESILAAARADAETIRTRAAEELKQSLARRTTQAEEKIARAEADAIAALRARIIDAATVEARRQLTEKVTSEASDPALAGAIAAIEAQLGNAGSAPKKRKQA